MCAVPVAALVISMLVTANAEPFTEPAVAELPETSGAPAADAPAVAETPDPGLLVRELQGDLILIVGRAVSSEEARRFQTWADQWTAAAKRGGVRVHVANGEQARATRKKSAADLFAAQQRTTSEELWIVLIGHCQTESGRCALNLGGSDLSDRQLADWLEPFQRPVCVIQCSSGSAPFLRTLARPDRVLLTATRDADESGFHEFSEMLAGALTLPEADRDDDGQISLLEAWIHAARAADALALSKAELPSHHAVLDDLGQGSALSPYAFENVTPTEANAAASPLAGARANQFVLVRSEDERQLGAARRAARNAVERELIELRHRKTSMEATVYARDLEELLARLAELSTGSVTGR